MSRYSYGCLPKAEDRRDYRFAPTTPYTGAFVDLSLGFPQPPYDQGDLGSCVSNGTAAILDFARVKQGLVPLDCPSRLFIYWNGRSMSGQPLDQDTGLQVRDGLTVVAQRGVPAESEWPYDTARFAERPPTTAFLHALLNEAVRYGAVAKGAIDATIASGYPVVFGFTVHESFETNAVASTGVMPVPDKGEKELGGHCVVAVSTPVDGSKIHGGVPGVRYRKCRNSWGHDGSWGIPAEPGYFWMPVTVMDSSEAEDFWVLTTVSDANPPAPPTQQDIAFAQALRDWLKNPRQYKQLIAAAKAWLASKALS